MKKNMGLVDRVIRVIAAVVVGVLYVNGIISGIFAIVLLLFAVIFLITSSLSTCPLYLPFGLSTRKESSKE